MLATQNLGKSYGARVLFEGVGLKLNPGARYGLVGANGSGKTTFLTILAGDEPATDGSVSLPREARVGVLRQDRFLRDDEIILDVAMRGDSVVWDALAEQHSLAEAGADAARVAELEDVIRAHDGYTLEARATWILEGLGIPAASHRSSLGTLSGGFKLRVLLAQVLLGGPDVLLLDEPTNHLDILSIRWLEKFLAAYPGCAVVISHDQRFLDNVATHILDVDYGTITLYTGNYSAFAVEKAAVRERKQAEIAKAEADIAHKRAFVERFRYKATKAAQAQSRLKQIDRIEVEELADTSRRAPRFLFTPERPSGRDVLAVEAVSKAYGDKEVLRGVSLVVRRGEKIAVIGPNGLGKSTLLRIVVGRLAPDAGEVRWGHEVRVGYFAQDHREILDDPDETVARRPLGPRPARGGDGVRARAARTGALLRRRRGEEDRRALRRRVGAADLLPDHGRAAERARARRADESPGSRVDPRAGRGAPSVRRDGDLRVARSLVRVGDRHPRRSRSPRRARGSSRAPTTNTSRASATTTSMPTPWSSRREREGRPRDATARARPLVGRAEEAAQPPERAPRTARQGRSPPSRLPRPAKKSIHALYASEGFFERTPKDELDALVAEEQALGPQIDALMAEWESLENEIAALGTPQRKEASAPAGLRRRARSRGRRKERQARRGSPPEGARGDLNALGVRASAPRVHELGAPLVARGGTPGRPSDGVRWLPVPRRRSSFRHRSLRQSSLP